MRNLRHLGLIRAHHSFIDPMASFEEIMRHMPQLDNQDRCKGSPQKTEAENLSNLCGNLVELRWLWVEVWL